MDNIGLECVNGTAYQRNIYTAPTVFKTVALGLIDLVVVLGNSLVITAVVTTRKLRTVTNIFIVSLACADLMLGFAVMPFSISYEVVKLWIWGTVWCSMWLAIDVWLCTASILSLCAISLDRYIAVTHPIRYPSLISPFRGKILVSFVWILSFVICLPPLLGWNDGSEGQGVSTQMLQNTSGTVATTIAVDTLLEYTNNMKEDDYFYEGVNSNFSLFDNYSVGCNFELPVCELTPTKGYRIYAALGSFYIPSLIMMFFYLRIYLTAVKTAASLRSGVLLTRTSNEFAQTHGGSSDDAMQLRVHRGGSTMSNKRSCSTANSARHQTDKFKHSSNSLSPGSTRSDTTHINSSNRPSPLDNLISNNKNNNNPSKTKQRSLIFWAHFNKRRNKARHAINLDKNDVAQTEFLNFHTDVVINGAETFRAKTHGGRQKTSLTSSPRKCKLLIKEPKTSSFNSKGHARKFHREAKAAKTLAIIVGAFIVCWCPFFTIYLIGAFCQDCVSDIVFSVFFWLGYINSALNPCIYALFARDFRAAFRRIILCKRRKGFNHATRADFITGTRKIVTQQQELDSLSD